MSFPEQEIIVSGDIRTADGETAEIDVVATQADNQVIRNAVAVVSTN
jgi:hypothetical protein